MATFFTGSDADGITLTASNDLWVNNLFTTVSAVGDAFNFAATNNNRLLVLGTIVSEDADAVNSDTGSFGSIVEVMSTGVVTGVSDGIELDGDGNQVINRGAISGLRDCGVQFVGNTGSTLTNFGSIYGGITAISLSAGGGSNTVENFGDVSGQTRGILVEVGTGNIVRNSGTIQADTAIQVSVSATFTTSISNTGTIIGDTAFLGFGGDETLINSGQITGTVVTGAGNDVIRNTGTIAGTIDLGEGADRYVASGNGGSEAVSGGAGIDTLIGGNLDDEFFGGDDADVLRGGGGADRLDGGNAADDLRGGDGNDVLVGGIGNDRLSGGAGDDIIDGGRSNDTLIGGGGADVFVIGEASGADTILDFADNVDTLDLSALGFTTVAQAMANATTVGGNTVFTFGTAQLTVIGIAASRMTNDVSINSLGMEPATAPPEMETLAVSAWWP